MQKLILFILLGIGVFLTSNVNFASAQKTKKANDTLTPKGWIDFNKNGTKDPFEDSTVEIESRIDDLLSKMTVNEKTGQLVTLYGYPRILKDTLPTDDWKNAIWIDGLGNIDEHANGNRDLSGSWPPSLHAQLINDVQKWFIEETRLGIPVDFSNEGIRGACFTGATMFPAQIGVGSTWNKQLVYKIGEITARESQIVGYTNIYSPILDLARDPRWGRTVEAYGEDPYLVGQLGLQQIIALQENGVVSSPKHFAVYSVPSGGRDDMARTDPQVTERDLHTLFLYPFKIAFTKGRAMGTMSSYNDYNSVPITGSKYFLTDLLRKEYGFKGYVVSDSDALKYIWWKHQVAPDYKDAVRQAIEAGMNVRTTFTGPQIFLNPLRELVNDGDISMQTIDDRVRDVLRVKFWLGLFDNPYIENPKQADAVFASKESDEVARQASYESIVLLKNSDNFLPLNKEVIKNILVVGPNADEHEVSISRYGPKNVTYKSGLEALNEKLSGKVQVQYAKGCNITDANWPESEIIPNEPSIEELGMIEDAVDKANSADVILAFMGENNAIVGEAKSRTSLDLPGNQRLLLQALHATGKPVVLILQNGRPLTINWSNKYLPAIIEAWFPGKYGNEALADIIFGDYNPGGKLSITFPKSVGQIPMCFPSKPYAQAKSHNNTRVDGVLYPFGYGLSYTSFTYSDLKISADKISSAGELSVSLNVTNSGKVQGDEVVQLYVNDEVSSVIRFTQELRGFERIRLNPGETKKVTFKLTAEDLQLLDQNMNWTVEPGWFNIRIGNSSQNIILETRFLVETNGRNDQPYQQPKEGTKMY